MNKINTKLDKKENPSFPKNPGEWEPGCMRSQAFAKIFGDDICEWANQSRDTCGCVLLVGVGLEGKSSQIKTGHETACSRLPCYDPEPLTEKMDLNTKLEIERRFLLKSLPNFESDVVIHIWQGYTGDPKKNEIRIRETTTVGTFTTTEYFMTRKKGTGLVREEKEIRITAEQFALLYPLAGEHFIEKIRRPVFGSELIFEFDLFNNLTRENGRPLAILEVELPSENFPLSLPLWVADFIEREITGEVEWSNLSLAANGIPIEREQNHEQ